MGAARLCPRCHVPLVTNHAHSQIWCPKCHAKLARQVHKVASVAASAVNGHAGALAEPHPPMAMTPSEGVATPLAALNSMETPAPEPTAEPICVVHDYMHERPQGMRRTLLYFGICGVLVLVVGVAGFILKDSLLNLSIGQENAAPARAEAGRDAAPAEPPAPVKPVVAKRKPPVRRLPDSVRPDQERAILGAFEKAEAGPAEGDKVPEASRQIDTLVLAGLQAKNITPSPVCSDAIFLRRAYLDVIGRIPTAEEAERFLSNKSPSRRAELIDQLLTHRDFADYWAMKWCDLLRVKSEFPINLWPNAVQAYHRWIRTAMQENLAYDQFARALLTANGSNFRDPPANFYRAVQKKNPPTIARAVALTFMGVRPEGWPKERWEEMENFFSRIGYKKTDEWKEEVVFFDLTKPFKSEKATFPDGTTTAFASDQDPREAFADWLITPSNPWFTRNIANRAWSWLLGRGIIHEPDDLREDNLPSNPELLAFLEQELIRENYDLRKFFRVILNSKAYQASSIPASEHPDAKSLFAYYPVRRLEAEVIIDAICQVTGTTEQYSSPIPEPFTYIPETHRSVGLADASITSTFLEMFGRSSRDTGLESERNNTFTSAQRLHLLNSVHILRKIEQGPGLQRIVASGGKRREIVDKLYLTILSRHPTEEELSVLDDYSSGGGGLRPGLDVAWTLMNTAEFLCRH